MDGLAYEYIVGSYLRSSGYINVKVTHGSGDYGVDVLAEKGGRRYAVQCKFYSNSVGISAVQEAVAGKAIYGCTDAMVVTNSTFTKAAKNLAAANQVILLERITPDAAPQTMYPSIPAIPSVAPLPRKAKVSSAFWAVYILVVIFFGYISFVTIRDQLASKAYSIAIYNIVTVPPILTAPLWIRFIFVKVRCYIQQKRNSEIKVKFSFSESTKVLQWIDVNGRTYDMENVNGIASFPAVSFSFPHDGKKVYFNEVFIHSALHACKLGDKFRTNAFFAKAFEIEKCYSFPKSAKKAVDIINQKIDIFKREPLLAEALATVIYENEASSSVLQRKMRVKYPDARELLDKLESQGYISPFQGAQSSKVFVTFFDILSKTF